MGILDALTSGFSIAAKNLKLWGILLVINVILLILVIIAIVGIIGPAVINATNAATIPQPTTSQIICIAVVVLIFFLIQLFVNSGIVGCVRDIVKTGVANLGDLVKYANKYFVRFVLFAILMLAIVIIFSIIVTLIIGLLSLLAKSAAVTAIALGVIVAIVAAIILAIVGLYSSLVPVIIVSEERGVGGAINGATKLLGKKFWATLGLTVVYWIMFLSLVLINYASSLSGVAAISAVSQIMVSFINIFVSLAFIGSFMKYYLSNV